MRHPRTLRRVKQESLLAVLPRKLVVARKPHAAIRPLRTMNAVPPEQLAALKVRLAASEQFIVDRAGLFSRQVGASCCRGGPIA